MRCTGSTSLIVLVALAGLAGLAATIAGAAGELPNFSGRWILNDTQSDDPAAVMRQSGEREDDERAEIAADVLTGHLGTSRPDSSDTDATGQLHPGQPPHVAFADSSGDPPIADTAEAPTEPRSHHYVTAEISRLEIMHAADRFDVTDGLDVTLQLSIDDEPSLVATSPDSMLATIAWDGETLVAREQDAAGRLQRVRRFRLSEDGQQLTVTDSRRLPGEDDETVIMLVYDRASATGNQ